MPIVSSSLNAGNNKSMIVSGIDEKKKFGERCTSKKFSRKKKKTVRAIRMKVKDQKDPVPVQYSSSRREYVTDKFRTILHRPRVKYNNNE